MAMTTLHKKIDHLMNVLANDMRPRVLAIDPSVASGDGFIGDVEKYAEILKSMPELDQSVVEIHKAESEIRKRDSQNSGNRDEIGRLEKEILKDMRYVTKHHSVLHEAEDLRKELKRVEDDMSC